MFAAVAISQNPTDPMSGLVLRDVPAKLARPGWALVQVVSSSLNMHDLWTLRGVGHPPEELPRILGCDAAGYDAEGNRVVVYPVIASSDGAAATRPSTRSGPCSQRSRRRVRRVPAGAHPQPPSESRTGSSFDEAACLPVAWGTAYRMLFTQAGIKAGDRVLVQGAGGGVASAAIKLAVAAGAVVYATSSAAKLKRAESWGARGIESGGPAPGEGRRRHRDRRRGDLVPLPEVPAPRWHRRHRRSHLRDEPTGRPGPDLLPAAADPRIDRLHA